MTTPATPKLLLSTLAVFHSVGLVVFQVKLTTPWVHVFSRARTIEIKEPTTLSKTFGRAAHHRVVSFPTEKPPRPELSEGGLMVDII